MAIDKHPFDIAAERLEAIADSPTIGNDVSPDYWELSEAADETVGDYPQALFTEAQDWGDSAGLGPDGFPMVPDGLPGLELQADAHWTDVLSSSLWSGGYLLSERALEAFRPCILGEHREYAASVRGPNGDRRPYTYIYFRNLIAPTTLDFERSEFYVREMLGIPKAPMAVSSFEDWQAKRRKASEGKLEGVERFSSLDYKTLYFRPGQSPAVDLFSLQGMGIRVYITTRLRNALLESGISGLEIKPNRRLFAGNR